MTSVSESEFNQIIAPHIDVVSQRLETKIIDVSDQFFAGADNLIKPSAPQSHKGQFIATGAVYDGWETRRHNPEPFDFVILQLGVHAARIIAAEIDTAHFNGNEGPAFSVEGYKFPNGETTDNISDALTHNRDEIVDASEAGWHTVFGKSDLGPSQRHFFVLPSLSDKYHVFRLRMYPDGGIARLRLYGSVVPPVLDPKLLSSVEIDFAAVGMGGQLVKASGTHFGSSPSNLLLPGRGSDMGDGWETARSRVSGHCDWAIIKLGSRIVPHKVVVDTAFYRGNYPQRYTVEGIDSSTPDSEVDPKSREWTQLVEAKGQADSEDSHVIANSSPITHVKLTIFPDGGVKRLRVFGHTV